MNLGKSFLKSLPLLRAIHQKSHIYASQAGQKEEQITRAKFAAYRGEFRLAKSLLSELVEQYPQDSSIWMLYTKACFALEEFDETERALKEYAACTENTRLTEKSSKKETTSSDYTIVLKLGKSVTVPLAQYMLNEGTASNIVALESGSTTAQEGLTFFDPKEFQEVNNIYGELVTISEIEESCDLQNIWHWVANDNKLYTTSKKGRYMNRRMSIPQKQLELIVRVMYTNISNFFTEHSPDLFVMHNCSSLRSTILAEVAKEMEVKIAFMFPTNIGDYLAFSPSPFEQFVEIYQKNENKAFNEETLEEATDYVHAHLRGEREPPDAAQLSRDEHKTGREIIALSDIMNDYAGVLKEYAKSRAKTRELSAPPDLKQNPPYEKIYRANAHLQSKIRSNPEMKRVTTEISSERAVLFALHSEPETALSLLSPHLPPQDATADIISRSLPFDCRLYIKDHPRMTGLRKKRFYDDLSNNYSNIEFISSSDDALEYLDEVDLVVTAAGTIGIEALMYGTPSVTLGSCHYQHLYGIAQCRNFAELPDTVARVLSTEWNKKQMRSNVTEYIASCFEEGYSIGWYSDLKGNYDYKSEEFVGFLHWFDKRVQEIKASNEWNDYPLDYGYRPQACVGDLY